MKRTILVAALSLAVTASAAMAQRPGRGPGPPMGPPPAIAAIDANGDGNLSADEIAKAAESLKKLDKNGDGTVSRDEMGMRGRGPGGPPTGGPGARPGGDEVTFESAPAAKDDAEGKILAVLDDLDKNQRRGMMNVPLEDGRLLRMLAESMDAKTVVEIGASNGYSGIWFGLALSKTDGRLITHEIDKGRAKLARENYKRAGVDKWITLVEGDAHEEVKNIDGPIDLLFLDADKEGYLDYLDKLLPKVRPGGLIVAHNMNTRQAYAPFVEAITSNAKLETLFLHMDGMGVAVSMKKR